MLEVTLARIREFLLEDQTLIASRDYGRIPRQVGSATMILIKYDQINGVKNRMKMNNVVRISNMM